MRRGAAALAVGAGAIALVALVGWMLGVPLLRTLIPNGTALKFNAAAGLLLGAIGAHMLVRPETRRGVALLGGAVAALGAVTLVEHLFDVRAGIDELLVRDTSLSHTSSAGRMAPNTALGLLCSGAGVWLTGRGRRTTVFAGWLGLATAAIGFVALVGVAAGVPAYTTVGSSTRVSLPAALALCALGLSVAAARPAEGPLALLVRDGPGAEMARRLVPLAVALPPVAGLLRWQGQQAGWYGTNVGILLLVSVICVGAVAGIAWAARELESVESRRRDADVQVTLQSQVMRELAEGVCVVRWSDSTIIFANDRFAHMLGLATNDLAGRPSSVISWTDPAGRADLSEIARAAVQRDGHWTGELDYERADGSGFPAHVTISGFDHPEHGALSVSVVSDLTEQLRAASEAQRQVSLFDGVLRAAQEHSIVGTDVNGLITVFNAGAEQMLGYSADEVIGVHSPALFHDEQEVVARATELGLAPGFEVFVHAALRGAFETREWTYLRKDGRRLTVSLTVTAMDLVDGQPAGFIGIAKDITQRRSAERLAADRARMLARSQAAGHVGSWEWDIGSETARWSDEQFRVHGYTIGDEAPPLSEYLSRIDPDDRETVQESMRAAAEHGVAFSDEYRFTTPAGDQRVMLVRGGRVTSDEHHPARLVGTALDVTQERAERAARHQAEVQFQQSFDEALVGMMILDLDVRYVRVNDAFCHIVGHERETLIGLSREQITHPDDLAADADAVQALLDGQTASYSREKRYIHADGRTVWASIGVTLVRDEADRPLHFIAQVQDITERRSFETHLRHMADHDPLTGLLNRRSFQRELDGHVSRVNRYGLTGAVLMIDLDNFKFHNDTRGHNAGDELIVRIAQGLRDRLRDSDVVARLGGDEFAVLLPEGDRGSAEFVATNLLDFIRGAAPDNRMGASRQITASVGIACFEDSPDLTGEEMMVNADLAMYDAKEHGKNRLAHYRTDAHSRPRIESQMKWATEIDSALREGRFELLFQPIVSLHTEGPPQFEALLRMRDSRGDLVPPGTFLYIAERIGLIGQIDRWVVGRAIDVLAATRAAGQHIRLEVNLSGHSIGDPDLLTLIEQRLDESDVDPADLIFEITETAAVANIARAAEFANHLSEIGCRFALDDFGAGFGSFYYLKHLPFDYLKIDGEFVRNCATNETDRLLIASVVQIARGMGKHTIAEVIEDSETVNVLTGLGVDYGQGYHLGRPAPLEQYLTTPVAHLPR